MRVLIAVVSCWKSSNYRKTIRETWASLEYPRTDVRFFVGRGSGELTTNEVQLDCDDSYQGLPSKVQAIAQWALDRSYGFMLKCDEDVVLKIPEFLRSGFDLKDFVGHANTDKDSIRAPWGFCYTLSKKAMELVVNAQLPSNNNDEVWVSKVLFSNSIILHHDPRYYLYRGRREDFVGIEARPLRSPPRTEPMFAPSPENAIAYCMFLHWTGFRALAEERIIAEMKKVFKEKQ